MMLSAAALRLYLPGSVSAKKVVQAARDVARASDVAHDQHVCHCEGARERKH